MNAINFTMSGQQFSALDCVGSWLKNDAKTNKIFRLFGYAGTGKTTIARHLASGLNGRVVYAAFTGKAAMMMQRSGCEGASTIHSLIYKAVQGSNGKFSFHLDPDSAAADADLIVLDECSMVDVNLARDLMSFGTPILALGDPEQLPPVAGEGYFTNAKPDAMLTEIHRQAKDSPVLQLATDIREGKPLKYGAYGNSRVVPDGSLEIDEILDADQLLAGRNVTRSHYNEEIRRALGRTSDLPEIGDRLVCQHNDHGLGIVNGGMFTVVSEPKNSRFSGTLSLELKSCDFPDHENYRVRVYPEYFTDDEERLADKERKNSQQFKYGYALTVHKAQGSQWGHVIIEDESHIFDKYARNWLYTAVTRASECVTLVTRL
ncbi:ATP-dependent RecD-like DNA helicase [Ruegeria conchae]|uniref:ATP-dependent DNA helicase n=1 Tax=Ruegeria conchae TaxID=981384 RepID=UPI0029C897D4|nr:AAA family ATPase [Ruegeria conchae]